jgi:hypothetical protein
VRECCRYEPAQIGASSSEARLTSAQAVCKGGRVRRRDRAWLSALSRLPQATISEGDGHPGAARWTRATMRPAREPFTLGDHRCELREADVGPRGRKPSRRRVGTCGGGLPTQRILDQGAPAKYLVTPSYVWAGVFLTACRHRIDSRCSGAYTLWQAFLTSGDQLAPFATLWSGGRPRARRIDKQLWQRHQLCANVARLAVLRTTS